jgi:hypothetical protein
MTSDGRDYTRYQFGHRGTDADNRHTDDELTYSILSRNARGSVNEPVRADKDHDQAGKNP